MADLGKKNITISINIELYAAAKAKRCNMSAEAENGIRTWLDAQTSPQEKVANAELDAAKMRELARRQEIQHHVEEIAKDLLRLGDKTGMYLKMLRPELDKKYGPENAEQIMKAADDRKEKLLAERKKALTEPVTSLPAELLPVEPPAE